MLALASCTFGFNAPAGTAVQPSSSVRAPAASMMASPLFNKFVYDPPKAGYTLKPLGADFAANMGDSKHFNMADGKPKMRIVHAPSQSLFSEFLGHGARPKPLNRDTPVPECQW